MNRIGLVQFNNLSEFQWIRLPKSVSVLYYGKLLKLELPKHTDNNLNIGHVLLTKIGQELAPICGSSPVAGFWDYVSDHWKQYLPNSETR